ncbi:MAG: PQQ-dependent sugar dehydrogenase [Candidatus Marinimicrobia bacterium]|nr:PQQ-dependent sugar dehydrogenase [Candidatus Neomarinimicrobiota bacterium]
MITILHSIKIFLYVVLFSQFLFARTVTVRKIPHEFNKPVYLMSMPESPDTLFIVEQKGVIQTTVYHRKISSPFLDIRDRVHQPLMPGDERGLLGAALHPNFRENGRIFLNYIDRNDSTIISEFWVDLTQFSVSANSEKKILSFKQPYSNHNGGQLAFDPDGNLLISVGDGGYAGDPQENGQNLKTLFGSILRINIDGNHPYEIPKDNPFTEIDSARNEIFIYGVRNAWRFSLDAENNDLYIADVGQSSWEEIHSLPWSTSFGANLGWNITEGTHCYPPGVECSQNNLDIPIFEYPNNANYMKTLIGWEQNDAQGCSVTGGYVYRGSKILNFVGHYFFGDYCTGKIWSFRAEEGVAVQFSEYTIEGLEEDLYLSSFGIDGNGELYILNHSGFVYKIVSIK